MKESPVWRNGLRIWHCRSCGTGGDGSARSVPGQGTSTSRRCSQKKKYKFPPLTYRGPLLLLPEFLFSKKFFFILLFRAALWHMEGSSQARGQIGATAAGLHYSHSNARSKPHGLPTPQLMATQDPLLTERGQGSNLYPHRY